MKQLRAFRNKKRLHSNKKGGIEGLPLQLLIIIVIASLGLAMMIGWMGNISEPDRIDEIQTSYEKTGRGYEVTVRVVDQNGYGVEGADVVLTGYGAYSFGTTTASASSVPYVMAKNVLIDGVFYSEDTALPVSQLEDNGYNASRFPSCPAPAITAETGEKTTPHGITDEEGFVTIVVHFDNLKTYGTLNVEASKSGYSESNTTMKVFA